MYVHVGIHKLLVYVKLHVTACKEYCTCSRHAQSNALVPAAFAARVPSLSAHHAPAVMTTGIRRILIQTTAVKFLTREHMLCNFSSNSIGKLNVHGCQWWFANQAGCGGGGVTLQRRTNLTALARADAEVQATGGVAADQAEPVARSTHHSALCSRKRHERRVHTLYIVTFEYQEASSCVLSPNACIYGLC